jgi:hypothetical protein
MVGQTVKLENWIDNRASGKNWIKAYEEADAVLSGRRGIKCNVAPDRTLHLGSADCNFQMGLCFRFRFQKP